VEDNMQFRIAYNDIPLAQKKEFWPFAEQAGYRIKAANKQLTYAKRSLADRGSLNCGELAKIRGVADTGSFIR